MRFTSLSVLLGLTAAGTVASAAAVPPPCDKNGAADATADHCYYAALAAAAASDSTSYEGPLSNLVVDDTPYGALPDPAPHYPAGSAYKDDDTKDDDGEDDSGEDDDSSSDNHTTQLSKEHHHDSNKVKLSYGTFTGFTFSPYNDKIKVKVHLGIPYAQPPVGDLRFLAPRPITTNLGDRNATAYGASCIQNMNAANPYNTSEDCLFLNVFAPKRIHHGTKLPVMVWLHGGNFDKGSSTAANLNGSTLVHRSVEYGQDVVVVTVNYRVGVFGFLASPEIQAANASNAGLRDQILAFRWVRDNIAKFGGDPTKVTAFGHSAGSCSIANHLTATLPASDPAPLFHAAIMGSGGVSFGYTFNWTRVYNTAFAGFRAATNCADLSNAVEAKGVAFRPYIDGDYIPVNPQKRLLTGDFQHVPVFIGTNTDEGTQYATVNTTAGFNSLIAKTFPGLPDALVAKAYSFYPLDKYANTSFGPDAAPFLAAADLSGDFALHCPSQRVADAYASFSKAVDPADGRPLLIYGVAHTYEVPFIFNAEVTASTSDPAEKVLARDMASTIPDWPKYAADPALPAGGGKRIRFDDGNQYVLEVDNVRSDKCAFWSGFTTKVSSP
ncbi:Alpha/Beta hydrolase protein [Zopfochytrium polystomum]|nr:Alpha/Beta hydrolase protein [Zopfochytrium polystomum]